ncbi:glycosyltransferase family 2 protein [Fibrobacterota bacterium]
MDNTPPKVSVIMATHNRADILPVSVSSVLEQTFRDFEFIITDDASSDHTPSVLKDLHNGDDRIIYQRSEQNIGPGAARNMAIERSRGEYVAIMDDDDACRPHRLEREIKVLDSHPDVGLVFSSVEWINENQELILISPGIVQAGRFPEDPDGVFELLHLEGSKIPNPTVMARRDIIAGFKYPSYPWGPEDRYMYLQMAARGVKMKAISEPLVIQRRETNASNLMNQKANAFRAQRIINQMIISWLRQNRITRFDHLHKLAVSNQFIREARYWQGLRGLSLCLLSVLRAPAHKRAYQTLLWFIKKAVNKLVPS